jgi:23S rRNA pseudouridine1911/1915/1917 synthase
MKLFSHTVKSSEANQRLDHFLLNTCPLVYFENMSRSRCETLLRRGAVLSNGMLVKPKTVIKTGDVISFPDETLFEVSVEIIPQAEIPVKVLFCNEYFVILDKPEGISMHPTSFEQKDTVVNFLVAHFPEIRGVGDDKLRPGIVHRLDKNTSGVVVVALTNKAYISLKYLFYSRLIHKTYQALVHGNLSPNEGIIDIHLARSLTLPKQSVIDASLSVRGRIRTALTSYRVLAHYTGYDFVEVIPKTGRKHQIRVHMASLGHPLLGDTLYGTKITRKRDQQFPLPKSLRYMLHAQRLSFELFGVPYVFESPLPAEFSWLIQESATTPQ